jgi:hypothetical protein
MAVEARVVAAMSSLESPLSSCGGGACWLLWPGVQQLDPCPASPKRGGVGRYRSSSLESSSLTTGAPLAGCASSGLCGGGGRRCTEDDAMRTTTALSRRQVGATRCAGTFLGVSRAFVSSGVPERTPGGRGWPGLAGWMKAQIRVKTRNRGRDWALFRRPDEKKGCRGPRRVHGWRCSHLPTIADREKS